MTKKVTVESVIDLTDSQIQAISQQLKVDPKIITVKLNKQLIGGLRVHIDGKIVDLSLQRKLQQLEDHLLHHEII